MTLPPVVIPTYNRLALLQRSIKSLEQSKHGEIVIVDDCSDKATTDYLATLPYTVHRNPSNIGADQNSFAICCMMAEVHDHFVISNSDMIYHPEWLTTLEAVYQQHKTEPLAAISPFLHKDPTGCKAVGNCYEFEHITGVQLIVSDFWRSAQFGIDRTLWDLSMSGVARRAGYTMLVTSESYVQHIGLMEGLHLERPDVGLCFKGE